jgi:sulfur-oxidizing protein SoxX
MATMRIVLTLGSIALIAGCASEDRGFTLPEGSAERGREAFVSFRCFDCHDVHNVELPERADSDEAIVKLGGEVTRAKRYGDLVTGIINPSHRLAAAYSPKESAGSEKSPMKVYNDVMTVAQLIDIVTFLHQPYELQPYEPTTYPIYYP